VIGDIYKLEERGTAIGILLAVRSSPLFITLVILIWMNRLFCWDRQWHQSLEVSGGPIRYLRLFIFIISGLAAEYASWRCMQFIIGIFGFIALGIIWFCFPETSHPGARGIDKIHRQAANGMKVKWTHYLVNPLSPIGLLRAPNILTMVSLQHFVGAASN
jgi:hypothetical protein